MRRVAILSALSLAATGLLAAPAWATYHLNMVNEVMLASSSGDSSVQFVEFLDHGGAEELFTPLFGPYKLAIYDGAGNLLSTQTLNPDGLRAAARANREYLVSTAAADTAFHVTGDERLTVSLPLAAGQACFGGSPQPPSVSCLTWGAITKPIKINPFGSGSANGPVPPNGESDQRQPDKSILAACPTPKVPNSSVPCAAAPPAAFAGVTFARKSAAVRHGRALLRLECPAGTDGSCAGHVVFSPASGGGRLGGARFVIQSARTATVEVRLSRAARRALRQHGKLEVVATAIAHDAAGTAKTTTSQITLRGRRA
jgi:hypothetical protein